MEGSQGDPIDFILPRSRDPDAHAKHAGESILVPHYLDRGNATFRAINAD
jgi:hypothetical protein